jgi:hypothetical protein
VVEACSAHGVDDKRVQNFGSKTYGKVVNNIKMDVSKPGCDVVDWIHLAQDRNRCRGVTNTVKNFPFYKRTGIS